MFCPSPSFNINNSGFKKMNKLLFFLTAALLILSTSPKNSRENAEDKKYNLADAKIKLYKTKAARDPSDYRNYNNLAQNYIQKARETGELDYYLEAKKAAEKSLEINPRNYNGTILYSKTKMAGHEFKKALEYAKRAVELKPDRSAAYGILGDAYLELGNTKSAEAAYVKMTELKPGLDSYSRISILYAYLGNYGKATEYMQKAYESGIKNNTLPPENLAWTQLMIGINCLDAGNYDEAEKYFENSLEIQSDYFLALEQLKVVAFLKKYGYKPHKHHNAGGKTKHH